LAALEVPKPPFEEQQGIVAALSSARTALKINEQLLLTAQELKRAAMREVFTRGLRGEAQKQTEIGLVPESWEVKPFEKIATLFNGFAFKSSDVIQNSNLQLLRMGNLYQNTLCLDRSPIFYPDSFSEKYSRFILKAGDIVMSLTGTMGKEDFGFSVKIPDNSNVNLLLNQRVAKINVIKKDVLKDYIFQYFLSRQFLDRLYPTAKGTKQGNLSSAIINKLLVVYPKSLEEQTQIVTLLSAIDDKITLHKRKKAALEALFTSLLHQLMTGKIRVGDLDLSSLNAPQTEAA
jgi:type I restriction enzyme S subunit